MSQVVDGFGHQVGVDIAGSRVYVHENGHGPLVEDAVSRGDKGKGGGDDQIAGLDAGGNDAEMQAAGAGIDADGGGRAHVPGKDPLKRFNLRADAQIRGA